MKRSRYSPALSPLVLKALFYEAARRGLPMTRLADACLIEVLKGTPGWDQAEIELRETEQNGDQNSDLFEKE